MFAGQCKHNRLLMRCWALTLFLLAGCVPMSELEIQVMDPAEVTFPLEVQQLAFLDRSVFPHLYHHDSSKWSIEEYNILDTIMGNWIFKGVRATMMGSPLFDVDTIKIIRARRMDTAMFLEPMTSAEMLHLRSIHSANAVISLEYYHVRDNAHVINNHIEFLDGAYLGLYTTTVWRIYDMNRVSVIDEFALRDTVDWIAYDETVQSSINQLPQIVDALREAGYNLGLRYGHRISPAWMDALRYYYGSGSKGMRMASKKAREGDWQAATDIWKSIEYGENQRFAAKACFNMAVACEMEDQLILALDWAIKSYAIRQKPLTNDYIQLLKRRYEKTKQLQKQLPAFEVEPYLK